MDNKWYEWGIGLLVLAFFVSIFSPNCMNMIYSDFLFWNCVERSLIYTKISLGAFIFGILLLVIGFFKK